MPQEASHFVAAVDEARKAAREPAFSSGLQTGRFPKTDFWFGDLSLLGPALHIERKFRNFFFGNASRRAPGPDGPGGGRPGFLTSWNMPPSRPRARERPDGGASRPHNAVFALSHPAKGNLS